MSPAIVLNRRKAVVLSGAAALAGIAARSANPALASVRTGGGISGGGWLQFADSEAQFSVFGSTFNDDEADDPILFGSFIWTDADGFTLRSTEIVSYGPDPDEETARILTGFAEHSESGELHPFTVRMNDLGGPGDELDTIEVTVGPAAEIGTAFATPVADSAVIAVAGPITVGDVQLLTFDFGAE